MDDLENTVYCPPIHDVANEVEMSNLNIEKNKVLEEPKELNVKNDANPLERSQTASILSSDKGSRLNLRNSDMSQGSKN